MQVTSKELYKEIAENTKRELSLVKSIGDAVFQELSSFFRNPNALICKLKGVGFWYMRKKKLNEYIIKWDSYYMQSPIPTLKNEEAQKVYLYGRNQFNILLDRQKQYELFLLKKQKIREIRHKTQPLQKPKTTEEC